MQDFVPWVSFVFICVQEVGVLLVLQEMLTLPQLVDIDEDVDVELWLFEEANARIAKFVDWSLESWQ
jgi:hypothetical protein